MEADEQTMEIKMYIRKTDFGAIVMESKNRRF